MEMKIHVHHIHHQSWSYSGGGRFPAVLPVSWLINCLVNSSALPAIPALLASNRFPHLSAPGPEQQLKCNQKISKCRLLQKLELISCCCLQLVSWVTKFLWRPLTPWWCSSSQWSSPAGPWGVPIPPIRPFVGVELSRVGLIVCDNTPPLFCSNRLSSIQSQGRN